MDSVNKLLNKISDFSCEVEGKEIVFPGILQAENENIVLNAKFPIEQYRKIKTDMEVVVFGNVFGTVVTLIGCNIKYASQNFGNNYISILAIPNEIVIGGIFPSTPMAKVLTITNPDLNYMFSTGMPLKEKVFFSEENPSVLNYTFPKAITANDKYGKIELYQTFEFQKSVYGYNHYIISVVEYDFNQSMPLMEAVAKISASISLFSFFGNGYVSYGKLIFKVDADENEYELWLNYKEDTPTIKEPFLIQTAAFENQFQQIWETWLVLYESANPIPTLFYEIVCNHSTRVNSFLNLSQAIEVYSNVYRKKEAKEVAKKDIDNANKKKPIRLKHRYQDVLSAFKDKLELVDGNIIDYATGLSNMRNYYTHYNKKSYVEPSYEELFSAIQILKYVLLVIVYTSVGISSEHILECKNRIIFSRLENNFDTILKYSKKK